MKGFLDYKVSLTSKFSIICLPFNCNYKTLKIALDIRLLLDNQTFYGITVKIISFLTPRGEMNFFENIFCIHLKTKMHFPTNLLHYILELVYFLYPTYQLPTITFRALVRYLKHQKIRQKHYKNVHKHENVSAHMLMLKLF